jgi:hypothetical protein
VSGGWPTSALTTYWVPHVRIFGHGKPQHFPSARCVK